MVNDAGRRSDRYLLEVAGPPDEEVAELERILAVKRYRAPVAERRRRLGSFAAAAALCIVAAALRGSGEDATPFGGDPTGAGRTAADAPGGARPAPAIVDAGAPREEGGWTREGVVEIGSAATDPVGAGGDARARIGAVTAGAGRARPEADAEARVPVASEIATTQ